MPVAAVAPYRFKPRDAVENFDGRQLLYVFWEKHMLFSRPFALCLAPDTPFSRIVEEFIPEAYNRHPDFAAMDWATATWTKGGQPFVPDFAKTLTENGVKHKAFLRFTTPGLDGLNGTGG